jgi:hypothetical protein
MKETRDFNDVMERSKHLRFGASAAYASRELGCSVQVRDVLDWRDRNVRVLDPVVRGTPKKAKSKADSDADAVSLDSARSNEVMMKRGSEMLAKRLTAYFVVKGYRITCSDNGVRVQ